MTKPAPRLTPPPKAVADAEAEYSEIRRLPHSIRHKASAGSPEPTNRTAPTAQPAVEPCPAAKSIFTPLERGRRLENKICLAQLVAESLPRDHRLSQLLRVAIVRRDAVLLDATLKAVHDQQRTVAESTPPSSPERDGR